MKTKTSLFSGRMAAVLGMACLALAHLSAEPFAAGQGIDVAPARFGGSAERPVFVRSHSPGKIARDDPEAVYVSISFWTYAGGKARPLASADGMKASKTQRKDAKQ